MGKIKAKLQQSEWQEHELRPSELNYLHNVNVLKSQQANVYDAIISGYLALRAEGLGYEAGSSLQFDIDLASDKPSLKIRRVSE